MPRHDPKNLSRGKLLLFSLIPVIVLIIAAEVIIRMTGAVNGCPTPAYLRSSLWICDPILQFKMHPFLRVEGRPLNSLGLRGDELNPDAKFRIVALGDSCTFGFITPSPGTPAFIHGPYPEKLDDLAAINNGPNAVSVLNAGVCGYNTYHGILLLRTKLRRIQPDLFTVRYGWNDLLTSAENTSPDAFREPESALVRDLQDLLFRTAIYPYGRRLALQLRFARKGGSKPFTIPPQWTPNVSVADYEHNLRRIVELTRGRDAKVWLLTSPDAFMTDDYRGREDEYSKTAAHQLAVIRFGGIRSFNELAEIHARYNEATRRVAAELSVPVVDMERAYREHASQHLFSPVDAIHPNEAGHALEAQELYAHLEAAGVVRPLSGDGTAEPAKPPI